VSIAQASSVADVRRDVIARLVRERSAGSSRGPSIGRTAPGLAALLPGMRGDGDAGPRAKKLAKRYPGRTMPRAGDDRKLGA
jgi:hypothetical protein